MNVDAQFATEDAELARCGGRTHFLLIPPGATFCLYGLGCDGRGPQDWLVLLISRLPPELRPPPVAPPNAGPEGAGEGGCLRPLPLPPPTSPPLPGPRPTLSAW